MATVIPSKEPLNDPMDCFIIMPISDPIEYEKGHFQHVFEDIIKVACKNAGYNAIRADQVKQTNLIHLDILQKLLASPMAVCDLSNRNPNVLFELGLRQAFDKPTVLVQEEGTERIFDISPWRIVQYRKELKYSEVIIDQQVISEAILATKIAHEKGEGSNSIVKLLALSSPAFISSIGGDPNSQIIQLLLSEVSDLKSWLTRPSVIPSISISKSVLTDANESANIINKLQGLKNQLMLAIASNNQKEAGEIYNSILSNNLSIKTDEFPPDAAMKYKSMLIEINSMFFNFISHSI